MTPSPAYEIALADCRRQHATSKTFSGRLLRPHAALIKEIIAERAIASVLDFGAGKGAQYSWRAGAGDRNVPEGLTLEEFWGVPVTKYDPAWPPYAAEPVGQFDLVLCTHVLGSIPIIDLPWVIDRLYALAAKVVYVAEKIGPPKKRHLSRPAEHPAYSPAQWFAALERPSRRELQVVLVTRERDAGSVVSTQAWLPLAWLP